VLIPDLLGEQACPVCAVGKLRMVGKPRIAPRVRSYVRLDYTILRCVQCGFLFVHPPIDFTDVEWRTLYEIDYFVPRPRWFTRYREKRLLARMDLLERHSGAGADTFIDVGCGEGRELEEAHRRGWTVLGIDIADSRLEQVKSNASIRFIKTELQGAYLPDESYDMVYVNSVLEHVVDPRGYLDEVHRITRQGGVLYLGVPNEDSLFTRTKDSLGRWMNRGQTIRIRPFIDPYHVNGFTPRSVRALLQGVGFQIVCLKTCGGLAEVLKYPPLSKGFGVNLALLPLHALAALVGMQSYIDVVARKASAATVLPPT